MSVLYSKVLNKWVVRKFSDDHNHNLVTPLKRVRMRVNRHMSDAAKDLTEVFYSENIPVVKVPAICGGETMGFRSRDCWNHLRTIRHHQLESGDAQAAINYFQQRQIENPGFFYSIEVDQDGRAVNFFWVDARSRMAYEQFGDMVTFDTTYRTNKYGLPFAPFTGVNHHFQSIQFGCALLQDETEQSFVWLFNTWLQAMGGRHPSSIITDQDQAMGAAIKKVFPYSRHRLCLWHIKKKFGEKLSHIYFKRSSFKSEMKKCIHFTYTVQDFEESWNSIIAKHNLEKNSWMAHLYQIREYWAPVYLRGTFFAGTNTTGRSEGANSFFNDFVTPKINLREFVVKYEQALKKIIRNENDEDYDSEHKDRLVDKNNLMLCHAAKIYTRNMFERFREQYVDSIRFKSQERGKDGEFMTYLVTSKIGMAEQFIVKLNENTYEGHCECQKFEFMGLLCKHLLKVLCKLEVDEIPTHFILRRWTKGANSFRIVDDNSSGENTECSEALRQIHLCRKSTQVWDIASKSDEFYKIALEGLEGIFKRIMDLQLEKCDYKNDNNLENSKPETFGGLCPSLIKDPKIAQTKGRSKDDRTKGRGNDRIKSPIEMSAKKPRICRTCKEEGHDSRKCPQRKLNRDLLNMGGVHACNQ